MTANFAEPANMIEPLTLILRKAPTMPTVHLHSLLLVATLPLVAVLASPLAAADAPPVKVGVLGLDNYQAVAFTQLFHDPKAAGDLAGIRVVAAFPAGSPD